MTEPRWRKSSFSGNDGDCVELASTMDKLRDSKNPDHTMTMPALQDFVRAVKHGRFGR